MGRMALEKINNQKINDEHLKQLLDLFPRGGNENSSNNAKI
jgi:hypothetical protein